MSGKVIIKVSKGLSTGTEYAYDSKELLILGRHSDCSVVFFERSVSRYHCLLDINPPSVMVRDFGSLNGTYLNGSVIGKRPYDMDADEARELACNEFSVKNGDKLGLGSECEITFFTPQFCSNCGEQLPEHYNEHLRDDEGFLLCERCFDSYIRMQEEIDRIHRELAEAEYLAEQRRQEADRLASERAEGERLLEAQRKSDMALFAADEVKHKAKKMQRAVEREKQDKKACQICGRTLHASEADLDICSRCYNDPMKVLEFLLMQAVMGEGDAKEISGYRKIRSLGRGGMGEVWLVEEERTGRQMALKLMLPKAAADERGRDSFLREAYLAQQLQHKNVVRQFSSGSESGTFFILQEFCAGGSVDDLIVKSRGKLGIDLATEIILQMLEGLCYTHSVQINTIWINGIVLTANGLVHRDIKPANIFLSDLSRHPVAKVADFGLSKAFETAGLSGHTLTGEMGGTPCFMPRQQLLNYRYAKPDVDVWASAASYYFMLTGTYPKDLKGQDMVAAILNNPVVPIRKRNPAIPQRLAAVIDEALVEKPAIGISSAAELKREIETAL